MENLKISNHSVRRYFERVLGYSEKASKKIKTNSFKFRIVKRVLHRLEEFYCSNEKAPGYYKVPDSEQSIFCLIINDTVITTVVKIRNNSYFAKENLQKKVNIVFAKATLNREQRVNSEKIHRKKKKRHTNDFHTLKNGGNNNPKADNVKYIIEHLNDKKVIERCKKGLEVIGVNETKQHNHHNFISEKKYT